MKLLIVILIINFLHLFGDIFGEKIYKYQLRGLHQEELKRLIRESIEDTVQRIYHKIVESARKGKNDCQIILMCQDTTIQHCKINKINNQDQGWSLNHPINIITTINSYNSYITFEQYTANVTNELNQIFPDIHLTEIDNNCCDYLTIKW